MSAVSPRIIFFGVHKVAEVGDGKARVLYRGTTIHGAQRLRNDDGTTVSGPLLPQTYYDPGGPYAEAIGAARAVRGNLDRVAIVGLGTGSLAGHRKGGERWTFFEIDPEVIRLHARRHQCRRSPGDIEGECPLVVMAREAGDTASVGASWTPLRPIRQVRCGRTTAPTFSASCCA